MKTLYIHLKKCNIRPIINSIIYNTHKRIKAYETTIYLGNIHFFKIIYWEFFRNGPNALIGKIDKITKYSST